MAKLNQILLLILLFSLLHLISLTPAAAKSEDEAAECASSQTGACHDKARAHRLNYIAIGAILVASVVGVSLPLFSRAVPAFHPEKDLFLVIRAFASGVIVATGFMHVMPDSWSDLTSPCLPDKPWRAFPFTPFITMVSAYVTMMMDSFAIAYFERRNSNGGVNSKGQNGNGNGVESEVGNGGGHNGHYHGQSLKVVGDNKEKSLLKDRVVAQVYFYLLNCSSIFLILFLMIYGCFYLYS